MQAPKYTYLVWATCFFFVLSQASVYGQLQPDDQNLKSKKFGLKDGLSQTQVNCIEKDKQGFVWVGTQDGLNRFDGYTFQVFKNQVDELGGLNGNYIHDILLKDNLLWIATDNGLNYVNTQNLFIGQKLHDPLDETSIHSNQTRRLFLDQNQDIWIGFANGDVSKFDSKTNRFTNFKNLPSKSEITCFEQDHKGKIWMGTLSDGIIVLDTAGNLQQVVRVSYPVKSVALDPYTFEVWAGTSKGIYVYDIQDSEVKPKRFIPSDVKHSITKIFFSSDKVYIGSEGSGFISIEKHENALNFQSVLNTNIVYDFLKQSNGVLWVGTSNGLEMFYNQQKIFKHYTNFVIRNKEVVSDNIVWALHKDNTGDLWIGTRNGLTKKEAYSGEFKSFFDLSSSDHFKSFQSVLSVFEDSKGQLWIGTIDQLILAKRDKNNNIYDTHELFFWGNDQKRKYPNMVYTICETKDQKLLFGTKKGLGIYDLNSESYRFIREVETTENSTLPLDYVRAIQVDSNNHIWIGSALGIHKLDISDSIVDIEYLTDDYVNMNNQITSIHLEQDTLWVGTYGGGLLKFLTSGSLVERYTEKDGLSNNVIYTIVPDSLDNFWFSTNKGICVFDREKFKKYTIEDGLQSNEFSIGAAFRDQNGEIFFGGINGYNVFNPKKIQNDSIAPFSVITDIKISNQSIHYINGFSDFDFLINDTLRLMHHQNNVSFDFVGIQYTTKDKRYYYKLEGFDEQWVNTAKRTASYNNLNPGSYVFMLRACNDDGFCSDTVKKVYITINPAFWQTWWFRVLAAILLISLVYLGFRARIYAIKNQNLVLEELVNQRTQEVMHQKEQIELQKRELEKQKLKSDYLLENILPKQTVEELQIKGYATARSYKLATVMFTDFKGFTKISEQMRPKALLNRLDRYFRKYDEIIDGHYVEKIKTMGDSYMCVGGIPVRNRTNPFDVVLAALEIQKFMEKESDRMKQKKLDPWGLRIGIHTGDLIAGVIGQKRLAYDIWGDTVNIANRMETTSKPGKINISGPTYELIKDYFQCTYRGKVEAKNKGQIDMYFVERIKEEYSFDKEGRIPNQHFKDKINNMAFGSSINYKRAEKDIIQLLKDNLPSNLYYHSLEHSLDVCAEAERIATSEGLSREEIVILKTAALYHDAGYIKQYNKNEHIGIKIARERLPKFGYTEEHLAQIESLILATSYPTAPKNKFQQIICDADLDYLGREDFFEISDFLKREYKEKNMIKTNVEWDKLQLDFFKNHKYYTKTSIETRKRKKLSNMSIIQKRYEILKNQVS